LLLSKRIIMDGVNFKIIAATDTMNLHASDHLALPLSDYDVAVCGREL
jgi:hypothetical protein